MKIHTMEIIKSYLNIIKNNFKNIITKLNIGAYNNITIEKEI